MTPTELAVQKPQLDPEFAQSRREPSAMEILKDLASRTDDPQVAVAVAKSMVELQQSMEKFQWEREERQARMDFDAALCDCQAQIERIVPKEKRENGIMWADYIQIDKAVRPLYTKAGFSISFSEEPGEGDRIRMKATVSKGGISKEYFAEISRIPTNSKMNQVDAAAAAASRVKRYLMLDIFNIAVGIDKDEKIGLTPEQGEELQGLVDQIKNSESLADCKEAYGKAYAKARELKNNDATLKIIDAYEKARGEFK